MTSIARVYFCAVKLALASRLAYRFDLIFSMITMAITEITPAVLTLLIYANSPGFPGWTQDQVLLLQGTFIFIRGFGNVFFFGLVWNTIVRVRDGKLDLMLLQPRSVLHMITATGFDTEDAGKLFAGMIIFAYAAIRIGHISALAWLGFALLFVLACGVLYAIAMIASGLSIRFVKTWRLYEIIDTLLSLGYYPSSVSTPVVNFIISFTIPILAVAYLPASALLGIAVPYWNITVIISLVFILLSYVFWNRSLAAYSSCGG